MVGFLFGEDNHGWTKAGDKNTTIARLRKLMFGATTEKSKDVPGDAEAG